MSLEGKIDQARDSAYRIILGVGIFVSSLQLVFKSVTGTLSVENSDMWADLMILSSFLIAIPLSRRKVFAWVDRLILGSTLVVIFMQTVVIGHPIAYRWLVLVIVGLSLILDRRRYKRVAVFLATINSAGVLFNVFVLARPLERIGLTSIDEMVPAILVPWLAIPIVDFLLLQRKQLVEQLLLSYVQLEQSNQHALDSKAVHDDVPSSKYQFSQLNQKHLEEMVERTLNFFASSDDYLDPNFQMSALSKATQVPRHHMSQVLNLGLGMSFYEILNRYRVDEVIRRFKSDEFKGQSILNIAYSVGFNSKSTFNSAFKRQTGKTPSEFRESLGLGEVPRS
ncbi:MAG: AraC family transcriptional regulator [Bdellovibrionaceae bacterium]|nr:AraC family transcriptional regulator [Bdellovibrionales bacterium]MCB9083395.1 AraC family transcriptional regulator [Pseudobdellovibrionaceae bacterium]